MTTGNNKKIRRSSSSHKLAQLGRWSVRTISDNKWVVQCTSETNAWTEFLTLDNADLLQDDKVMASKRSPIASNA